MADRVTLRPTTAEDVDKFCAQTPPWRIRATTALIGERIIGIGGISILPDGTALAFTELAPDARRYAVTLHRAGIETIRDAQRRGIARIVAELDAAQPAAERWLLRLGFKHVLTRTDGQQVYAWQHFPSRL